MRHSTTKFTKYVAPGEAEPRVSLTVRMPRSLAEQVRRQALVSNMTINDFVLHALRTQLEEVKTIEPTGDLDHP